MTYQGITRRGKTQEIVNKNCHCRVSLSGISPTLAWQKTDPRQKPSGMTTNLIGFILRPSSSRSVSMRDIGAAPRGFTARGFISCRHPEFISGSSRYNNKMLKQVQHDDARGFTLIELLVVVLIIGILAAVAVPQYQVAVQKAKLMKYVPIVRALNEAEQVYFLANGEYTADLRELDIEIPTMGCTYEYTPAAFGYYQCGTERYGVWGSIANAQAGDDKIRYLQFFADYDRYNMKAGDVACYSKGEIARKACRSLGPGSEQPNKSSSWEYVYTLNR